VSRLWCCSLIEGRGRRRVDGVGEGLGFVSGHVHASVRQVDVTIRTATRFKRQTKLFVKFFYFCDQCANCNQTPTTTITTVNSRVQATTTAAAIATTRVLCSYCLTRRCRCCNLLLLLLLRCGKRRALLLVWPRPIGNMLVLLVLLVL